MLIEETNVPDAALPVAALKAHLRMGTGFGQDTIQDGVLSGFLRAAMAAVEARTGKALIEREFTTVVAGDARGGRIALGIAPVTVLAQIQCVTRTGQVQTLDSAHYWLERDTHTPCLRSDTNSVPCGGAGAELRIRFLAGYGPEWDEVPADMQQAVLMLAAHYYEYRHDTALTGGCMPFGVTSLIERFRALRVGRGAGVQV